MNFRDKCFSISITVVFLGLLLITGCQPPQPTAPNSQGEMNSNINPPPANMSPISPPTSAPETNSAPQASSEQPAATQSVTLPVLDAMFAEENFAGDLKSKLGLTDDQIGKLKQAAHDETAKLKENAAGSTTQASQTAQEKFQAILGTDKTTEFTKFISQRWATGGGEETPAAPVTSQQPNGVPTDTRIVVNAPAYRMDLYKDGKLVRTYKIGIGYPEFPLPSGMRKASQIIFNPTWTPPDEPWVEGSSKVKAGKKVEAGSSLNPLGPIKIPIGMPSLIHGGKIPARLGTFASHGCVGLTNPQVQDFAMALAQLSGTEVSSQDVDNYAKKKTETKNVKLNQTIPVELRYETIVVQDGKLHVYRDVYERGTNTEDNLRKVLQANGVAYDKLTEPERAKAKEALKQMALDAGGNPVQASSNTNSNKKSESAKVTRVIKGKTEVIVDIAALKGKGYPAPVDLNVGIRTNKPLNLTGSSTSQTTTTPAPPATGKK